MTAHGLTDTSASPSRWRADAKVAARAELRLFCFPHAGGSPQVFRTWAEHLPAALDVWSVLLPGRGARAGEPAQTRLEPLVDALADALAPWTAEPFALFGHSMGALVSFELARRLRRWYRTVPVHLFVAAYPAPQLARRGPTLHTLSDRALAAEVRRLGATPDPLLDDPDAASVVLAPVRADLAVCETYRYSPQSPLECPITVFGGEDDPRVSLDELAAWRDQTSTHFAIQIMPGDHFFVARSSPELPQALLRRLHER